MLFGVRVLSGRRYSSVGLDSARAICQAVDLRDRCQVEACEDVAEVGPGFNSVGFAACYQRHPLRRAFAGKRTSHEQPIFSSRGNRSHRTLCRVVVDRQVAILDVAIQRIPLVASRGRCLANQTLGQERLRFKPLLELIEQRTGMFCSHRLQRSDICFAISCRVLLRLPLDVVQPTNHCQRMMGTRSILLTRLPPIATTMRPTGNLL